MSSGQGGPVPSVVTLTMISGLVQVGAHRVLRAEVRAGADQGDRMRAAAGGGEQRAHGSTGNS
jgi:hypothetical protein